MTQQDQQSRSLHLARLAQACQELNQAVTRIEEALTPFLSWGPIWVGLCRRLLQAVEQVRQPIADVVEHYAYVCDTSSVSLVFVVHRLDEHLDEACIKIAAYQAIGEKEAMSEVTLRKRVALRKYIQQVLISDLKALLTSFSPEVRDHVRVLLLSGADQSESTISQEGPHHDH